MKRSFTLLLTAILAVSCIDNDLDYPLVPGGFVTFEVDGEKD